ncbi:hypothetical protein XENOCAPTIV_015095 [Xenoophorus captivus]|uniref:Uncharacterized protein n=1 Tax=Xenoophorus captivus TaxID=1517983 RepID=A0ABV0S0K6_9TELE
MWKKDQNIEILDPWSRCSLNLNTPANLWSVFKRSSEKPNHQYVITTSPNKTRVGHHQSRFFQELICSMPERKRAIDSSYKSDILLIDILLIKAFKLGAWQFHRGKMLDPVASVLDAAHRGFNSQIVWSLLT